MFLSKENSKENLEVSLHSVSEELRLYVLYLGKKADKKRISYLRAFLSFCVRYQIPVSEGAINEFLASRQIQNKSIRSILNVFRKYCQARGLVRLWQDNENRNNKGNALVLRFLLQYDFKNNRTKRVYQNELNLFILYMENKGLEFGQVAVQEYINEAIGKGISVFTLNTRLSVIKAFATWFLSQRDLCDRVSEGQIANISNILSIKSFKTDRYRYYKESLSVEERDKLIASIDNIKDKAIVALQVYEGLRSKEVCSLLVEDLDFENNTISVLGKGKYKKEKIRLFEQSKCILEQYLHQTGKTESSLFGIRYIDVYKIVKKYLPDYSPHCLRHTAAQVMLEQGIDAVFVQRQMRHRNYQTTQIYTQKIMDKLFFERFPKTL